MAKSKRKPTPRRTNPSRTPATGSPATRSPRGPVSGSTSTPGAGDSALRTAVAERSRGVVVWLSRQPQFLIPTVMVALVVAGLAAPVVVAVVALALVLVFIGWLAFLSWPVLGSGQRGIRVAMIVVLVVALVGRVAHWF